MVSETADGVIDWCVGDGIERAEACEREREVLGMSEELEPGKPELKTSSVEIGGSIGGSWSWSVRRRVSEGSMAAHQAEGAMNSEARHCRFNRLQLLQMGFFSSQRA